MAFVFGKAKKTSTFTAANTSPGPGDYKTSQKPKAEHAAPFNCSAFKTSLFDVDPTQQAGPGSYNPLCQKQIQAEKAMRMTSSFSSKVQRFKTEPSKKPQQKKQMSVKLVSDTPYRYNPAKNDKSLQKQLYHQVVERVKQKVAMLQQTNRKRKSQSIGGNRQFVRIVLSNPKNTEVLHSVFVDSSITKKQNGPGSYNIDNVNNLGKGTHVVDWSRNTVQRFKSQKNKNPGPGAYKVEDKVQRLNTSQSAAFAFQGLRSHMDQVIYRTRMPFKVKVIEEKKLKDRYPGPGHYDPHKISSKSFHYGEDRFGSTQYQPKEQVDMLPGPGYYQIAQKGEKKELYKDRLKKDRQKIFGKPRIKGEKVQTLCDINKEEVRKQCIMEIQRTANKFYSLQERCSSKVGDFSHADRWRNQAKHIGPGPGQYKVQTQSNEQKVIKNIPCGFNSAVQDRSSFLAQSYNTPFYEVDRNDMGKRALRVRKNIENLKQIEIEKAPFNSKEKRFGSDTKISHKCSPDKLPAEAILTKEHCQSRQSKLEMIKKMAHNPQLTSQFKSKTKRSWLIATNQLGPGDYNHSSFMEKKSFNQEYNYNPPVKIRSTYRTRSSVA